SVNAAKSIGVMEHLRLSRAHASGVADIVAGIENLLHLCFGELAAISLLDELGKRVDIGAGRPQRANSCTRSSEDFPLAITRQQANRACELSTGRGGKLGHDADSHEIRSMTVGPLWLRSRMYQANAVPLLALGPAHPARCIIGKRRRKT